jgi:hypothetical protein
VNAIAFVQLALLAHPEGSESPQARRTEFNSFFFTCALLYEALLLVERLAKHYQAVPAFGELRQLLKDRTATDLRNSSLSTLRNQLTFHFSESEIGKQLAITDIDPRFLSSHGRTVADVYYELADACTMGAFAGFGLHEPGALEELGEMIDQTANLAERFRKAAEKFIASVLLADVWERR